MNPGPIYGAKASLEDGDNLQNRRKTTVPSWSEEALLQLLLAVPHARSGQVESGSFRMLDVVHRRIGLSVLALSVPRLWHNETLHLAQSAAATTQEEIA